MSSSDRSTVARLQRQRFLFGPTAAQTALPTVLAQEDWERVAVLCSSSARRNGTLDRVIDGALGALDVQVVDHAVRSHAPVEDARHIADRLARIDPHALVAVGGGSVMDAAKGAAILRAEGGDLEDHCSVFTPPTSLVHPPLDRPKLPIVAVPTTLSGAETTPGGSVTTADGLKRTFWDEKVAATVVCFDFELMRRAGTALMVTTGMNALAHCAESLYSKTANPVATAFAVEGAERLTRGLTGLAEDEPADDSFSHLAAGAALGGLAISTARVGIGHAVCHVLGGRFGIPHGTANSIILPHALRYNLPVTVAAQERLAKAVAAGLGYSAQEREAAEAAELIEQLRRRIGAPERLRDVGLEDRDLQVAAAETMQDRGVYFNPRPIPGAEAVLEVLRAAR